MVANIAEAAMGLAIIDLFLVGCLMIWTFYIHD